MSRLLESMQEIVLLEGAGTPEIFADGAVITHDRAMTRLVLFSRRFLGNDGDHKHQVVGRVTIPPDGWRWTISGGLLRPATGAFGQLQ